MNRTLRFLLLGLALLCAQSALAAHGVEHSFHDHDEPCVECLVLPCFAAVPVLSSWLLAPLAVPARGAFAVPPGPIFSSPVPFRSRAPPVIQST